MRNTQQIFIHTCGKRTNVCVPIDDVAELRKFREFENQRIIQDCINNPKKYLED